MLCYNLWFKIEVLCSVDNYTRCTLKVMKMSHERSMYWLKGWRWVMREACTGWREGCRSKGKNWETWESDRIRLKKYKVNSFPDQFVFT